MSWPIRILNCRLSLKLRRLGEGMKARCYSGQENGSGGAEGQRTGGAAAAAADDAVLRKTGGRGGGTRTLAAHRDRILQAVR